MLDFENCTEEQIQTLLDAGMNLFDIFNVNELF
jgi:hypothetical protein